MNGDKKMWYKHTYIQWEIIQCLTVLIYKNEDHNNIYNNVVKIKEVNMSKVLWTVSITK